MVGECRGVNTDGVCGEGVGNVDELRGEVQTWLQELGDIFLQELQGERRRLKEECGDGRAGGLWAAGE